jgi:hypothetical protein
MIDRDPQFDSTSGRRPDGTFAPGNRAGRGNPFAKRAQELRSALYDAVSTEDLRQVVAALVTQAKSGDVPAAREVLDRLLGKAAEGIDLDARIEALEDLLAEAMDSRRPQ